MTSILGSEWHISAEGNDLLTENGAVKDHQKVLKLALNTDLKEICSAVLVSEIPKEKISKIVLQIQKVRNISAPKANEESQAAPRMLKLSLTDGDSYIQALEISSINSISRNHTPPGSKILVNNAKIISGYILLTSANCTVLGGKVPHLVEKWEIAKSVQRNNRGNSTNDDGPPPWVNFGAKIQTGNQDGNFKALTGKAKEPNKENTEFELLRQGAIAEATSGAIRKVFGGRVKQNVQQTTSNQNRSAESGRERQERGKNRGKFMQKEKEVEEKPLKPSEKVSLFAFLEDKLPVATNQNTAKNSSFNDVQVNARNPSNINKSYENYNKPYNNSPKASPDNFNLQNRKDFKQGSYNKTDKPTQNNRYERNTSAQNTNQFNQQTNNYQGQYDKQNKTEKPQANHYQGHFDKTNKPHTNYLEQQQYNSYQPYDKQNRFERPPTNHYQGQYERPNKFEKMQTNNYQGHYEKQNRHERPSYQDQYDKQNRINQNNFVQQHERPQHHNNEYNTSASKAASQSNVNNTPKDKEVNELTNSMGKLCSNSQFASRTLRQHLNLGPPKKPEETPKKSENVENNNFSVGDECMAKYWEDGRFYNAIITAVTAKTYAVKFKGYGNIEEILKGDCLPLFNTNTNQNQQNKRFEQSGRPYSGSMEFRRSTRNYK